MEQYDFSVGTDRRQTGCVKWDDEYYDDLVPMWVADMDFPAAPCVQRALTERVAHGVYGYEHVPDSYYESVVRWFATRHGWQMTREEILPATGLLPALVAILHRGHTLLHGQGKATAEGVKVIMQMPAYNGFLHCLTDNGVELTHNAMRCDEGHYTIDWDDLERKAQEQTGGILLFCNPHNPTGRVWTRDEMERVADLCRKYDLLLISDEIHGEVMPLGGQYIPMATIERVRDRLIVFTSPGKGFNLAGTGISNVIVPDKALRERVNRALEAMLVTDVGVFGVTALQAAYNEGAEWLDAVNKYIGENYRFLCDYVRRELPRLRVTPLEGTYLAWVWHGDYPYTSAQVERKLMNELHVRVSAGTFYGEEGEGYMRVNIACPRSQLEEGLRRMKTLFV
ncbi:MAG: PatB family C-S lyase [Paludibacteraceae bacterium]|nr:PatB family C-S lyase [Paludibacteraceae bacterium]